MKCGLKVSAISSCTKLRGVEILLGERGEREELLFFHSFGHFNKMGNKTKNSLRTLVVGVVSEVEQMGNLSANFTGFLL